jgi:prepilin-type N-terminal cleavage/methylation domain-containing protein
MRHRKAPRGAFTLVELLVVITIIGMLMAMMFPALGAIMQSMAKTQCKNRMEEVAKGVINWESSNSRFPGYVERVRVSTGGESSSTRAVELRSWIVAVLKHIKEPDYMALTVQKPGTTPPKYLKWFQCPSSEKDRSQDESIDYVANCGRKDSTSSSASMPADWKANGVFMKKNARAGGGSREEIVTSTDIKDQNRTLLISENLQATKWTALGEADIGMVWQIDSGPDPNFPAKDSWRINRERDAKLTVGDYDYARPSSNHPGGAVVVFADSTSMFMSEDVRYADVYCKLMMSDRQKAMEPGQKTLIKESLRSPFNEEFLTP